MSPMSCSNLARVSDMLRCLGPDWSAVMNGRLRSVDMVDDSSIFAFSAASFRRCRAILSFDRSMPWSLELFDDPVNEAVIDVVAAEVRVTVGRLHFDDAVADF